MSISNGDRQMSWGTVFFNLFILSLSCDLRNQSEGNWRGVCMARTRLPTHPEMR
jgi:hypothetical protein